MSGARRATAAALGVGAVLARRLREAGSAGRRRRSPRSRTALARARPRSSSADLCAACHGDDLRGGRASSLLDDTWVFGGSDAELAASIRDGRPGTLMPPFKGALDERQIRSLVVLIRELAEKARVEAPKAARAALRLGAAAASATPSSSRRWRTGSTRRGASSSCRTAASCVTRAARPAAHRHPRPARSASRSAACRASGCGRTAASSTWRSTPTTRRNGWIYLGYSVRGPGRDLRRRRSCAGASATARGSTRSSCTGRRPTPSAPPTTTTACGLLFDRAGHLFYSIGDRGQKDDAQSLASPHGKIHRVLDDGSAPEGQPLRRPPRCRPDDLELRPPQPAGARVPPGHGRALGLGARPARRRRAQPDRAAAATTAGRSSPSASTTTARRSALAPSRKAWSRPVVQWTPSLAVCGIAFYTGDRFPGLEERPLRGRPRRQAAAAPGDRGRPGRRTRRSCSGASAACATS